MKSLVWSSVLVIVGCSQVESRASIGAARRSGGDTAVALADVPAHVKEAALKAVPGLVLTKAETEVENGVTIYDLTGTAGGKEHEVEVTANGTVQEIESGDDDCGDGHEHGDDDDDGPDDDPDD